MNILDKQETVVPEAISDNEVIARVLQGEKNLYAVLVRRYNQRLYRIGMSIIDDVAEVEDIMQVAYIKAYENLGKFAFLSGFSTWLTRILINESLLRLKQRKKSLDSNREMNKKDIERPLAIESENPLTQTLNTELKAVLEKAIRDLPEKYRVVFIMREIENLNVAETKECLQINETNVKVRLHRAKSLLKDSLSAYVKNEDILHFHLTRCNRMVEAVMNRI